ncbi:hypothetical protein [Saccharothrix obliqua]|uniref:hypothetical protein n=1 Tax=Saccharothrix obliqua TaxID=2861747 RepID=UPI001C5E6B7E|nr:hypothetical protein [Saccharothrix obliqua]MBW4722099.1 hypothetical protein [Saccharothrix obliqua]
MEAVLVAGLPERVAEFGFRWGGVRVEGGRVRLVSSSGGDVTALFPELRGLGLGGPRWVVPRWFAGVVAKRLGSPYLPGVRSSSWLAVAREGVGGGAVGGAGW